MADKADVGRRDVLKHIAGVGSAAPFASTLFSPSAAFAAETSNAVPEGTAPPPPDATPIPAGYQSFSPDEAAFVEAMVNIMCPPDHLTPNGTDCGLATYIDRQLAGGYGKGELFYMRDPWKQGKSQQFLKAGIAAADEAAREKFGKGFVALAVETADACHQLRYCVWRSVEHCASTAAVQ